MLLVMICPFCHHSFTYHALSIKLKYPKFAIVICKGGTPTDAFLRNGGKAVSSEVRKASHHPPTFAIGAEPGNLMAQTSPEIATSWVAADSSTSISRGRYLRQWTCRQCQHTLTDPRSSLVEMDKAVSSEVRKASHHPPTSARCWAWQLDGASLTRDCNFPSGSRFLNFNFTWQILKAMDLSPMSAYFDGPQVFFGGNGQGRVVRSQKGISSSTNFR